MGRKDKQNRRPRQIRRWSAHVRLVLWVVAPLVYAADAYGQNTPPTVVSAIPDTTVNEDAAGINDYRDLTTVFQDAEDGSALAFAIRVNSNPTLLAARIDSGDGLDISVLRNQSGSAMLVIRATDSEALFVEDTLVVTVTPVNDAPVIVASIPDTTVLEDSPPIDNYRDLNTVFSDVEDGAALTFTIESNSNPGLITARVDTGNALDLSIAAGQNGSATLVIRATDSGGLFAEDTVVVDVIHKTLWVIRDDGTGDAPTIQAGIDAAQDGDTVLVTDGVYTGPGNRNILFRGKSILVTSENGPDMTTIDCGDTYRGFDIGESEPPTAVLRGFTIANAAAINGGGIHISLGASPTILDNVITGCTAVQGGGINCSGGTSLIRGNVIVNNRADVGGGIYVNSASPMIDGNTIIENRATTSGGGIYLRNNALPLITNTIIAFNGQGGGIACVAGADPTVTCSDIFGNAGGDVLCGTDGGGNISLDPLFCGPLGTGVVTLQSSSPCAPANNSCGVLIGAMPAGCQAPVVVAAIPDTTLVEDSPPIDNYRDLNDVFSDEEEGSALTFAVSSNTNPALINATLDADSALDLSVAPGSSGMATIVVTATDSTALSAADTFLVTVVPANYAPVIVNAIPDTTVGGATQLIDNYRDLNDIFIDQEDGNALTFSLGSISDPSVATATIDADSSLDLSIGYTRGASSIVVRATDSGGLFVEDTFIVTVDATTLDLSAYRIFSPSIRPGDTPQPMFLLTIANESTLPETLTTISFTNVSQGPGSPAELDASFSTMTLDALGGRTVLPGGGPGPASSAFSSGRLTFSNLEAVVPSGGSLSLTVGGGASLVARDGDMLDLALASPPDVVFTNTVSFLATWPMNPPDLFIVDGMVSQQITVHQVRAATFAIGSVRNLALDVDLPANGYDADRLNRLNVMNLGTALDSVDIALMEAWVDDGDGLFDVFTDRALGAFSFTGSRWELTGLSVGVPAEGARVFVTVDIDNSASEGRTIHLALPTLPDVGVGMDSGNDGPIDQAVGDSFVHTIGSNESIVLSGIPLPAGTVQPGSSNVLLLQFVATNNYPTAKRITRLVINNSTIPQGIADQADLDREFGLVTLQRDGNANGVLEDQSIDPVIGTSFFNLGEATFTGLSLDLSPGTSAHFFVTTDVSLTYAHDGDAIGASITDIFAIDFADATVVTALWPIESSSKPTVDGMISAQVTNVDIPSATLAPNDGPILALDLVIPGNGYAADTWNGFEVINLGTADQNDLSDIRLWKDGGDGVFSQGGGDDIELAPLVWTGGSWKSPVINQPLPNGGTRAFVSVTVSGSPTDSTSVRLAVPLGGIIVSSTNDGPIDSQVASDESLLLSTAPLLASLTAEPTVSTTGQTIAVLMTVRNVGAEQINNVTPSALTTLGTGGISASGGPQPATFDLAAGAVDTFMWSYTTTSAGDIQWRGSCQGLGAVSGLSRNSLESTSNHHQIFDEAGDLALFPVESMPFFITRGQTDVVPISLTFSPSGSPSASSARVVSLRLRLEDDQGNGIVPGELLSRVMVSEGNTTYLSKSTLETSGAEVDLTLATPAVVPTTEQVTLAIRLDITQTTTVPNFRVVIENGNWIIAEDAISGAPILVTLQQGSYPIESGLGSLVVAPTELDAQNIPGSTQRVGWGAQDVPLVTVRFDNPGITGLTTDISVATLGVNIADTSGTAIPNPYRYFERMRLRGPFGTLAERALGAGDTTMVTLSLSPFLNIPTNTPVELTFEGVIAQGAPTGPVRVRLFDPLLVDARDSNTGAHIPVVYRTNPIEGETIFIEAPAESLLARGTALLPPSVMIGEADVAAMNVSLRHPGPPGVGRIRVDELTVRCQNEIRNPLVPDVFVDRLRVFEDGQEVTDVTNLPISGDRIVIPLPGLLLEPGTGVQLDLVIDISPRAPQSFFELVIDAAGVRASDLNTNSVVAVDADSGGTLPLTSGLTQLLPPATELVVDLQDRMPPVLAAGTPDLTVAVISMRNTAPAGASSISVDGLVIRASDRGHNTIAIGSITSKLRAVVAGTPVGETSVQTADSTTAFLPLSPAITLAPQETIDLELRVDFNANVGAPSVRMGIMAGDIGVVQPGGALLQIRVEPPAGKDFPLWTEVGNFSDLTLKESFSNFPNPFAAGGESTTFVYYLAQDASVSLKIWTARGEAVKTLRRGTPRSAGLHQDDIWDGRNGRGVAVYNGVYIAELVVEYNSGGADRLLRKVAVVR